MAEDKSIVKHQSRDGQEITLSFETVRKYLVSGNRDKVTPQELMYFLGVCKSRGLNPFKKDAYLIKYGDDPAAIVTSIDYFRSRARAQKDCTGWDKGIIVKTEDGTIKRTHGLLLEGEKLLGGFFEATPEGWKTPFQLEVNLNGYIKKTRDGKTTRFWQAENQPTMIAKVAESQGLRTLWPDEFQGLYEEKEIQPLSEEIELRQDKTGQYTQDPEPLDTSEFDKLASDAIEVDPLADPEFYKPAYNQLNKFLELTAQAQSISVDRLKVSAAESFAGFWAAFEAWRKKNYPEPPTEDFSCPHCEFVAQSERGLKKHITQQHGQEPDPEADADPDDSPDDDFHEQAEREAKIRHIQEGYPEYVDQAKFQLNIKQYPLDELSLDMLEEVLARCKDIAEQKF